MDSASSINGAGRLMRAILLGLLAVALLTKAVNAQEGPASANSILPGCQRFSQEGEVRDLFAQGFCVGIVRTLLFTRHVLPPGFKFCPPENVTTAQMVRVVVAYIEGHPQRMHEDFRYLAIEAFHEAWPCS